MRWPKWIGKIIIKISKCFEFGELWNEAKVNNSHALTTLLYPLRAFTLTFKLNEVGIHVLQTKHLQIKSPKSLREVEFAKEV